MKTIIRIHTEADFSSNNIGIVDYEPAIELPQPENVIAAYRTKISLSDSVDLVGGSPALLLEGTGNSFTSTSFIASPAADGDMALTGAQMPAGPSSFAVVFKQQADAPAANSGILGSFQGVLSSTSCMLLEMDTGVYKFIRAAANTVELTKDGGERWEMIVCTSDPDSNEMVVYRPRTGTTQTGTCGSSIASVAAVRAFASVAQYSSGRGYEGAMFAVWGASLSESDVDDLYARAKTSLAVSGINI